MAELTELLAGAKAGDPQVVDRLFTLLYDDLAAMARARLRRGHPVTLADTGVLVHESWLRLQGTAQLGFEDRNHFLAHAARVMRSVIVDMARRSHAERRGGGAVFITLDTQVSDAATGDETDVLLVAEALQELAQLDPRLASVVEMRYFAGLSETEIAAALGVAVRTVRRDWEKARAFLVMALKS
jgi:RNA polymerase sigma factor (TIGR02999 family)